MPELQLTIAQGELLGCLRTTDEGFQYNSYSGIPYAKPPIGELRFKDPVPADGWSGVRDATEEGQVCPQIDRFFYRKYIGDEDCLFLNVFTPASAKEGHNLPVMVWLHGGAFTMGSGSALVYGPDHLLEKNVIVVSLNYRLGVLGFLCLHTSEVPGNAGLKDQILALQWVQKNISKFGGDRNNVTIFGESAGSVSIQYILTSEMGNGLFQRAIMQSGSCLGNWACQKDPEKSAIELAKKMGLDSDEKKVILQFLRDASTKDLITSVDESFQLSAVYNFAPVIEEKHPDVNAFITTSPLELLMSGKYNKVPIIMGFNSQEGVLFISKQLFGKVDITELSGMSNVDLPLPNILKSLEPEIQSRFVSKVNSFYFPSSKLFADGYIDLLSDLGFILDIDRSIKIMSQHGQKIYYYMFDYDGSLKLFNALVNYPYDGAAHCDELHYLFRPDVDRLIPIMDNPKVTEVKINRNDIVTIERMVEMWTSFAKGGNPTVKIMDAVTTIWKPVTANEVNCLKIDTGMKMITNPLADRMDFWTEFIR